MNRAGTLWAGYGISIVAVLSYVAWLLRRARVLGNSLDIAESQADSQAVTQPETQENGASSDATDSAQ